MLLKIGDLVADRYKIEEVLKGHRRTIFSAVYLAYDEIMKRMVVIKALVSCPPNALLPDLQAYKQEEARFNRELDALNDITSRSVVILYDVLQQDNVRYMILEYLRGGTLADLLKRKGKLDWRTVQRLGLEICRGLRAIHSADEGWVHLDIAPSNIFLRYEDEIPESSFSWAVIGDLGEARLLEETTQGAILESDLIGTEGYRSPEVLQEKRATPQSDIYSLGVVLFEALTGKPFHRGEDFLEALSDGPKSLADVILKATRNGPTERFKSASEMYNRLIYTGPQEEPVALWRTVLEAILIGVPTTFIAEFVINADSPIPISLAMFALLATLGLGFYWRKKPDKKWYSLGVGVLIALLSLATAFIFAPHSPQVTDAPKATSIVTPTPMPTSTPNQEATGAALIARIFATQTALAPMPTNTPTPTNIPTPTDTPPPTHTSLPDTPTPSATPLPPPTNTPLPPPPTSTPTQISRPEGIFSFSGLVNGRYQTYIYNLADSVSTPLYIHDSVVDADIQPGDHRLAYRWADSGRGGIWRMDLDGSNQQMLTTFVEDRAPNWSADGAGIFLSSTREGDHSVHRVFRINADGSSGELRMPTVGRDPVELAGGQLLFAGWLTYDPGACGIIYFQWRRASGAGEIVGTEGRVSDQCSDYRPDALGNQVVFMRQGDSQSFDIWRNQAGFGVERSAVNITPDTPGSNEILPVFSPDGQWLAFASNRGGAWGIYAVKTDGSGQPTQLLEIPTGTDFNDWNLSRLSWAN